MLRIGIILLTSLVHTVSIDCPNIRSLALSLGIQSKKPAIWSALQTDCCTATGVNCDVNQRVLEIVWFSMGLNGTINGTAIPSSVTSLYLSDNDFTGRIPSSLPIGLVNLYLRGNQMTGDLPSFPFALQRLYLHWKSFYGDP